jgi:hypothetical protein
MTIHADCVAIYGDPDPKSAGTAGEAALWGGSIAVVGNDGEPARSALSPERPELCCAPTSTSMSLLLDAQRGRAAR